jgi:hypothetical protein
LLNWPPIRTRPSPTSSEAVLTLARRAVKILQQAEEKTTLVQIAAGYGRILRRPAPTGGHDSIRRWHNCAAAHARIEGIANFYRGIWLFQQDTEYEAKALFTVTIAKMKLLGSNLYCGFIWTRLGAWRK